MLIHHPDSNPIDRLMGIGSKPAPPDPDPKVLGALTRKDMQQEIGMHRRLFLHTQPIGPIQALMLGVLAIISIAYLL